MGIAWIQVYAPRQGAKFYTMAQKLAMVAQKAYEGRRSPGDSVVYTSAAIMDQPVEAGWYRYDCKVSFYWDEIRA